MIRGRSGEFLLVSSASWEEVVVFDAEGEFRTTFGGRGEGPGEFRSLGRIVPAAAGNYVHDLSLGRVTLFDHTHERVSEYTPAWGRPSSWILVGDSVIVAASSVVPGPDRIGRRYHVLDRQGHVLRSFGESEGPTTPATAAAGARSLAEGPGGSFFAVTQRIVDSGYDIEWWTLSGELLARWRREDPRLRPPQDAGRAAPGDPSPPSPGVRGLVTDENGLLWVFSVVATADWHEHRMATRTDAGVVAYTHGTRDGTWDTVIDVIDPSSGTVVLSERIDRYTQWIFSDQEGVLVQFFDDSDELFTFFEVHRLRLEGLPSEP